MKETPRVTNDTMTLTIVTTNVQFEEKPTAWLKSGALLKVDVSGSFRKNCSSTVGWLKNPVGISRDNWTKGIKEFSVADVTNLLIATVFK